MNPTRSVSRGVLTPLVLAGAFAAAAFFSATPARAHTPEYELDVFGGVHLWHPYNSIGRLDPAGGSDISSLTQFSHGGAFGVRLADDTMKPMFLNGDAVLVAVGAEPQIGRPALCKLANERGARCRIWLGQDETHVHLGRLTDGEQEDVARQTLAWSLEVLYRLAA